MGRNSNNDDSVCIRCYGQVSKDKLLYLKRIYLNFDPEFLPHCTRFLIPDDRFLPETKQNGNYPLHRAIKCFRVPGIW